MIDRAPDDERISDGTWTVDLVVSEGAKPDPEIAVEALDLACFWAFETYGIPKVVGKVAGRDVRRVADRLGYARVQGGCGEPLELAIDRTDWMSRKERRDLAGQALEVTVGMVPVEEVAYGSVTLDLQRKAAAPHRRLWRWLRGS